MVTDMGKKHAIIITILLLFSFQIGEVAGQTPWELEKDTDGILAYTRHRDGIKFKEYKVEMTIDATHDQILSVFKDYDRYPDLFPGTSDVAVMMEEEKHYVTYIKFNLPFPVRDRDALFDNSLSYDAEKDLLRVDVHCLTDEFETNPKLIQITFCDGSWEFTELGNGKMKVVHQLIVDPAGSAPAFIVNSKAVDDPIKTYKALRKLVNESKYKGHTFPLLEN